MPKKDDDIMAALRRSLEGPLRGQPKPANPEQREIDAFTGKMEEVREDLHSVMPPDPTKDHLFGEFVKDPKVRIRRHESVPPPAQPNSISEEERDRRNARALERAFDNALRNAEHRARRPRIFEGFFEREGFVPDGSTSNPPSSAKPKPDGKPSEWSVWVQRGLLAVAFGLAWWLFEKFDAPVGIGISTVVVCLVSVVFLRWLEKTPRRRNVFVGFLMAYFLAAIIFAVYSKKPKELGELKPSPNADALSRIEFRGDSLRPLKELNLTVRFNKEYKPDELGQFRVLIQIVDIRHRGSGYAPVLWLGCRDGYPLAGPDGSLRRVFGVKSFFESRNPDRALDGTYQVDDRVTATSLVQARFSLPVETPFKTLDDLNNKIPAVFISESLVGKIEELTLVANGYVIIKSKADTFNPKITGPAEGWPSNEVQGFRDQVQPLRWRTLVLGPANGPWEAPEAWMFDFDKTVPVKSR